MEGTVTRWMQLFLSLAAAVIWAAAIGFIIFLTRPFSFSRRIFLAGMTIVFFLSLIYIPHYCGSCRYVLTSEYIEYRRGILFQFSSRIQIEAVMTVTEICLPFSTLRGTCSLLISAMGGRLLLPLINHDEGKAIMHALTERASVSYNTAEEGNDENKDK